MGDRISGTASALIAGGLLFDGGPTVLCHRPASHSEREADPQQQPHWRQGVSIWLNADADVIMRAVKRRAVPTAAADRRSRCRKKRSGAP